QVITCNEIVWLNCNGLLERSFRLIITELHHQTDPQVPPVRRYAAPRLGELSEPQFGLLPFLLPHQTQCLCEALLPFHIFLDCDIRFVRLHGLLKLLTTHLQFHSKLAAHFACIVLREFNCTLKIPHCFTRTRHIVTRKATIVPEL